MVVRFSGAAAGAVRDAKKVWANYELFVKNDRVLLGDGS